MPSPSATPTPITPPRVPFIDERTGLIDRAWYMFFLSLFTIAQGSDDRNKGTDVNSLLASYDAAIRALQQEVETQPEQTSELEASLNAVRQELQTLPKPALGTMAQLQQAWLPWVTWDTAPEFTPPDVGTLAWDGGTTLGVQMTTNVLGRVNESGYYYIKASSAITKGNVVMFTGAVGASGVPTGAPATGITDGSYIMGIAAESIALNGFGLVQFIGTLRGVNLSAYADGDILWYNPAVAGGLTKTKPSAPNVKVQMAAVISASNNGTMLIRVTAGSELGGTDSNVLLGALANGQTLIYNNTGKYWQNATLTAGSNVSITNGPGSITIGASFTTTGSTGSVTLAKITAGGTDGSLTFADGLITAYTAPT